MRRERTSARARSRAVGRRRRRAAPRVERARGEEHRDPRRRAPPTRARRAASGARSAGGARSGSRCARRPAGGPSVRRTSITSIRAADASCSCTRASVSSNASAGAGATATQELRRQGVPPHQHVPSERRARRGRREVATAGVVRDARADGRCRRVDRGQVAVLARRGVRTGRVRGVEPLEVRRLLGQPRARRLSRRRRAPPCRACGTCRTARRRARGRRRWACSRTACASGSRTARRAARRSRRRHRCGSVPRTSAAVPRPTGRTWWQTVQDTPSSASATASPPATRSARRVPCAAIGAWQRRQMLSISLRTRRRRRRLDRHHAPPDRIPGGVRHHRRSPEVDGGHVAVLGVAHRRTPRWVSSWQSAQTSCVLKGDGPSSARPSASHAPSTRLTPDIRKIVAARRAPRRDRKA